MVAERLRPDKDGISDDERKWLMQNGAPPAHWNVWIAAYSGVAWRTLGIYQSRGTLHVPAIGRPAVMQHHAESTVWGMGHLLFLVVGTNWPDMAKQIARARGRGLFRIWPASPLSLVWPPLDVLGDPQANAVANFFSLTGAFDNSLNPLAGWTFTP